MPVVNHDNLVWARQLAELSLEEAANKVQLRDSSRGSAVEKLEAYESGEKEPSRSLLSRMSSVYKKPLLSFYLSEAPSVPSRGEDFRTLPAELEQRDSFYVDTLIRDIRASQQLLKEALVEEDEAEKLPFVGIHTIESGLASVVGTINTAIRFSLAEFRQQDSPESAFRYLRTLVEQAGVYVILRGNLGSHHTNISVQTFRGFALSDDVAPFIVINDKDAKSAWSFTLLHEFAHIVLGKTGVSGGKAEKAIEKFCNDVASEVILPAADFRELETASAEFEELRRIVSEYAGAVNVSASLVAYRLFARGDISNSVWQRLSKYFKEQWLTQRDRQKAKNKTSDGGPSYYVLRRHSLGKALVGVVQRYTQSGTLSTTDAGILLGVRPLKVHKVFMDNMPTVGK